MTTDEHQAEKNTIVNILKEMFTEEPLIRELDEEVLYYKPTFFHSERHLAKLLQQNLETKIYVDSERVKNWIDSRSYGEAKSGLCKKNSVSKLSKRSLLSATSE